MLPGRGALGRQSRGPKVVSELARPRGQVMGRSRWSARYSRRRWASSWRVSARASRRIEVLDSSFSTVIVRPQATAPRDPRSEHAALPQPHCRQGARFNKVSEFADKRRQDQNPGPFPAPIDPSASVLPTPDATIHRYTGLDS
jgi:hypothetical protein